MANSSSPTPTTDKSTAPSGGSRSGEPVPDSDRGCELVCVDPARVHEIWPYVDALIRPAMERVGISDHAVLARQVHRAEALLWVAWDGAAIKAAGVTQITLANGRKLCTIVACGGEWRTSWIHLINGVESYARAESCAAMMVIGRTGWSRILPDYRSRAIVLEKEL